MIDPYSEEVLWIVIIGFIMAFVLAFGLGANDVANSFGTSVGSKVLTVKQACCLATVCEIAGSILLGYKVSDTMRKGILQVNVYDDAEYELLLGMFAALIGSSVMLLGATFLKLPVSATHSIVGATIGFSLVCRGDKGINWKVLGMIVGSWFVSPLLSGVISVSLYLVIRRLILNASDPIARGLLSLPIFYGITIFINVFTIVHEGSSLLYFNRIPLWGVLVLSFGIGALTMVAVWFFLVPFMRKKIEEVGSTPKVTSGVKTDMVRTDTYKQTLPWTNGNSDVTVLASEIVLTPPNTSEEPAPPGHESSLGKDNPAYCLSIQDKTEEPSLEEKKDSQEKNQVEEDQAKILKLFSFLQTLTATFASFVHGGNDVSNAIGPVIAIWMIYTEGSVHQKSETPLYILLYGGVGISVGLWIWGKRVMKTIGEDLTTITSSTGFTIELGAAFTVLLASKIGLPVSTTHCLVGSVVFVGWANSTKKGVDWKLFRNIVAAWLVTVPISGLLSAAAVAILKETAL
ncbi:hypothetical protein B7P43_G07926 [Cryptotermes secundus]|uniref:Phosphate transporter n=1 Tax=Cryptotermes secundus TaxID=105785 RepID=A0A2J7QTM9_9NEOP|nr:hypothetical protein B7P43_G07926 [Cryptotermes secundus]